MARFATARPGLLASRAAPPLFSTRTVGVPVALACGSVVAFGVGGVSLGLALLATGTVSVMQLAAPWVRQHSRGGGVAAVILYLAPYVLFFVPYLLWTLAFPPPWRWNGAGSAAAVSLALGCHLLDLRSWRVLLHPGLMRLMPPVNALTVLAENYQFLASAVFQELFYRGALFVILLPALGGPLTVALTSALFTLEHYGNRWGAVARGKRYYPRIALLAAALGSIAWLTGSPVCALIGHVMFNLVPMVALNLRAVLTRNLDEEQVDA
jgi:hypothetical protein